MNYLFYFFYLLHTIQLGAEIRAALPTSLGKYLPSLYMAYTRSSA